MSGETVLNPAEISRKNLKNGISILKLKRKALKEEIKFIERSFNGGLAVDCMEFEAVLLKVKRVLNERLHHIHLMWGDESQIFDGWVHYDGGNLMFEDKKLFHFEDAVGSFEKVYEDCVQKIIENELDEDIKPFFEGLKFFTTK